MTETKSLLVSFFQGSIGEHERLQVERALLTDPETLLDYLDLKRKLESAVEFPQQPSHSLWLRLQLNTPRRRFVSLALGGALAAGLLLSLLLVGRKNAGSVPDRPALFFDSLRELPSGSNVL